MLTTTKLAEELNLSKGRISQLVGEGRLDGCYQGDGRARRFDLQKVATRLGKTLDPGQMMGNGSQTKKAIEKIRRDGQGESEAPKRKTDTKADEGDPDRYELARIQKAEEEARRLRRQNAEAEGHYVLASEASLQTRRQIGKEIAGFEQVLRDGARMIADQLGVDFKTARQILIEAWRTHRRERADALAGTADAATMTQDERGEDI